MPEIPRSLGPQVRTAPLPAPLANPNMASPDAFGASIGEGLQRGGVAALQARQQYQERVSDTRAMDSRIKAAERINKLESDARQRTGSNARGLPEWYSAEYQKIVDEVGKDLQDDLSARDTFQQVMASRRVDGLNVIQRHADDELDKFENETWEAANEVARQEAFGGVISIDKSLNMQRANRERVAADKGEPADKTSLKWQQDKDLTIGGEVENRIDLDDIAGAKLTLDQYGDQLSEPLRARLAGKVKDLGVNQRAQDTSDAIFKSGYAVTKADADRMVSVEKDADLRGRIQAKVDNEWARREEAVKIARGKTYSEIAKAADEGADPEALILKHEDAAALTQGDKDNLREIAARRARRQEPPAGSADYYALRTSASMTPGLFLAEDLNMWRGLIPERERQGLIELQADLLGRPSSSGEGRKPSGLLNIGDISARTLREIDIDGRVVDGKRDPRADAFDRLFDRAVEAEGGTQNLNNTQLELIAKRIVAEETLTVAAGGTGKFINFVGFGIPGMLTGVGTDDEVKVRAFEQEGADDRAFSINQVPKSELPKIIEALTKSGTDPKDITEDAILTTYNAAKAKAAK